MIYVFMGIPSPSDELAGKVLTIPANDNIYYDARILANNASIQWLKNSQRGLHQEFILEIRKVTEKLNKLPQPPFFDEAIKKLDSEIGLSGPFQN